MDDIEMTVIDECINDNEEIINKKYEEYTANWNIYNSKTLYLIDISKTNEQDMLNKMQDEKIFFGVDENMISINLIQTNLNYYNFADKKSTTTSDGRYFATNSFDLPSGIKAYQIDIRDLYEGYEPGLEVYTPYQNDIDDINTLVINTNIVRGSESENDFYDIVNSLSFTK